ncbi:MAG: DUF1456 family protein [Candidatus Delongbacteria bacterium]|nr:DUF1456 family protein [Candidatus Delongbacteria bacterium]MBN2835603.1 DUF1456 family protein [Candidatus Delongbacteria bacterium]
MDNGDIFRRLRYILDLDDSSIVETFRSGGLEVEWSKIYSWLKKDDDPAYTKMHDKNLAHFLNGIIISKRGKKDDQPMIAEKKLDNNLIIKKLKIAFNLKSEDIVKLLDLTNLIVSENEVTAFFRRKDHKHYRECKDQFLRAFLKGLQINLRGESSKSMEEVE